jgi:hypothetical protein
VHHTGDEDGEVAAMADRSVDHLGDGGSTSMVLIVPA